MVTYYNKKDLVSFGNYLLSEERKKQVSEVNQENVTHADIENWRNGRIESSEFPQTFTGTANTFKIQE